MIEWLRRDAAKNKSAVIAAAESLGVQPADVESWLGKFSILGAR